jgi:branched-chain amino acid transport system ATP-binding protein
MVEALLEVADLSAGHGETVVLEGVSLRAHQGRALAVLGRNGVGKSTLLTTLLGLNTVHSGTVRLAGQDIASWPAHQRARAGMGLVPQEREIFRSLSVEENLQVAAAKGAWTLARVYELFPRLAQRRGHLGHQLSGGEQQMLAIGRALIGNPRVLLLDEPFEGLAPIIVETLVDAFRKLRDDGELGIVLVEQHAELALELTESAIVLDRGRVVWQGASAELLAAPQRLHSLIGLQEAPAINEPHGADG